MLRPVDSYPIDFSYMTGSDKSNKEFSTDGVTLSVKARPQFFDE